MQDNKVHLLVVKHGALGDVVRTSYFAEALRRAHGPRLRLSWLTAPAAMSLLRFNPHVDDLWTDASQAQGFEFDRIFSLDDEIEVVEAAMGLRSRQMTGAVLDSNGNRTYTADAAEWFDMGLLSRHGKERADQIKKENLRSHGQIFERIFGVGSVRPGFWGSPRLEQEATSARGDAPLAIGINPFAGGRWRSKELPAPQMLTLVQRLLTEVPGLNAGGRLVLLGAGQDRQRNLALAEELGDSHVLVPDTDDSVLRLAATIRTLDYLISSDSLALHLAIAQGVPFLAFFAPTSAVEIDDFGLGVKLVSTAADYCSYSKDADNRSITAERILELATRHKPGIFASRMP